MCHTKERRAVAYRPPSPATGPVGSLSADALLLVPSLQVAPVLVSELARSRSLDTCEKVVTGNLIRVDLRIASWDVDDEIMS